MDVRLIPLGAKRDPEDKRDFIKYESVAPVELPKQASVRHKPPIRSQGTQASCTGHAAIWFWEQVLASRSMFSGIPLSPLYPWYYARVAEGNADQDTGLASMRGIMAALHKHGAPPLERWPYGSPVDREPDEKAQAYGQALKLPAYSRCKTLWAMKYAIAKEDQSVCIGLCMTEDWYSSYTRQTGIVPMPRRYLEIGRHAMVVCGYDDEKQLVILANSWGTQYGDGGFNHVPYAYLDLDVFDAWTAGYDALPDVKNGNG